MAVVTYAKTILTKTMFWTSMMCVQRTLPSVKQTSADSKWFLWTPRAPPRLTPTGWSGIRARSWCRLSTVTLALLLVCNKQADDLLQMHEHKVGGEPVLNHLSFQFRFRWIQRSGLQWNVLHQHGQRWRLRWVCVWLPVQFTLLHGDVETDHTDILVSHTHKSSRLLWPVNQSGQLHHGPWWASEERPVAHRRHPRTGESQWTQYSSHNLTQCSTIFKL